MFRLYAEIKFPFDNSQNALVVPQTGHSTPNNRSIRQKCGNSFTKSINIFLNNRKVRIIRKLLNRIFKSFWHKNFFEKYLIIHLGIIEISIYFFVVQIDLLISEKKLKSKYLLKSDHTANQILYDRLKQYNTRIYTCQVCPHF